MDTLQFYDRGPAFPLTLNEIETPTPDTGISIDDVKEAIRRIRQAIEDKPELRSVLGFLLEDVPEVYDPDNTSSLASITAIFKPGQAIELGPRLSRSGKQAAANEIERLYNDAVGRINEQLVNGEIGVGAWYEAVRKEISNGHVSTYSTGRSGAWSSITFAEWGRLGQRIRRQNQFLQGFADDLRKQDPETLSLAYINNRTGLYGSAFRESLEAGNARDRGLDPSILPAIPGDGTTRCLVRCKCRWTIRAAGRDRFLISWRLGRAEHCSTCLDRSEAWVDLVVEKGVLVSDVAPIFHNHN